MLLRCGHLYMIGLIGHDWVGHGDSLVVNVISTLVPHTLRGRKIAAHEQECLSILHHCWNIEETPVKVNLN